MLFDDSTLLLAILFLVVGALYASVGHAGASGYLAVMALMGFAPESMRPTALAVNVLVSVIAFVQFRAAGHFSWRLTWPFLLAAPVAAFLGAAIPLSERGIKIAIGVALLLASLRMAWSLVRDRAGSAREPTPPSRTVALVAGGIIGLISGITGTGGGIVLSPLMLLCNWADPKQVAGTSALFILCNSIAGLGGLALEGWTPHPSLLVLAIGGAIGGAIGARVGSRHLGFAWLRGILGVVVFIAAVKLVAA